uniref:DNA-directed RNA polymerase III subunit, putative n=1 Tax=Arundo donax TaxID=35708 RepID=A0A0A9CRW8_ARUDO
MLIQCNQCIVLFIDVKIFDQSITQKIIERTDTIPQFFHMMLFHP